MDTDNVTLKPSEWRGSDLAEEIRYRRNVTNKAFPHFESALRGNGGIRPAEPSPAACPAVGRRPLFHDVDPDWSEKRVRSGLSSGEGLIYAVRDDDSLTDKRLLASESEFATVLRVMEREGNTISARLRDGWDGRTISTLTRNNPPIATGAHISLVGHITRDELFRYMTKTETANGFANRIPSVSAGRSKLLPDGGEFLTDPQRAELGRNSRKRCDSPAPPEKFAARALILLGLSNDAGGGGATLYRE